MKAEGNHFDLTSNKFAEMASVFAFGKEVRGARETILLLFFSRLSESKICPLDHPLTFLWRFHSMCGLECVCERERERAIRAFKGS